MNARTQYFASISANLLMLGYGCGVGWLSMALPLLKSQHTPLQTGPLTVEEISWIGSAIPIGAVVGNILCGYIATIFGSRHSILLLGLPELASWLFLTFGTNPMHLVISRFLVGFTCGGSQVCAFLYLSEIADNDVRGRLGTIANYARNFGILMAFTVGAYFDYIYASIVHNGITLLFFATFLIVPSTPQYLLQKNQLDAAEKSFKFYNRHKLESDRSIQFDNLKKVLYEVKDEPELKLKDIMKSRYALLQTSIMGLLNVMCASFLFLTYGSEIIEKSGTHLSSDVSSIFMGALQLLANCVSFSLIDRKGRKLLIFLSMLGCTLGHGIMFGYLYLFNNGFDTSLFHWTPIIGMSMVIFTATVGIASLASICMAELFPMKTRSFGLTIGNVIMNIGFSYSNKVFPILVEIIGLQGCLLIFCLCSALGTVYTIFCMEETNGKELNNNDTGNRISINK